MCWNDVLVFQQITSLVQHTRTCPGIATPHPHPHKRPVRWFDGGAEGGNSPHLPKAACHAATRGSYVAPKTSLPSGQHSNCWFRETPLVWLWISNLQLLNDLFLSFQVFQCFCLSRAKNSLNTQNDSFEPLKKNTVKMVSAWMSTTSFVGNDTSQSFKKSTRCVQKKSKNFKL